MKKILKRIAFTAASFSSLAVSKPVEGPSALSIGLKSALHGMQKNKRRIFGPLVDQLDQNSNNFRHRGRNKYDLHKSEISEICNVENIETEGYKCEKRSYNPNMKMKGGGFTSPPKKKINASTSPKKRKKAQILPPVYAYDRPLLFWENMICGAISRSVAQTVMHPANTMKTILQTRSQAGTDRMTIGQLAQPKNIKLLTRGAGAQLLLSVPHGAVNFAVLEFFRRQTAHFIARQRGQNDDEVVIGPAVDFVSSAISTFCCSVVSTPQMMITDNIMAGTYPNLKRAVIGLAETNGVKGFYTGWWPGLAGKIPSYGLTWVFFQRLKKLQLRVMKRDPTDIENSIMGCIGSATTVCIMIPMDTVKTRLVTQANYPDLVPYKGIVDCAKRIAAEEGMIAFYRGLAPRLISVVPMIGIQFGVYEFMKKAVLANNASLSADYKKKLESDNAAVKMSLEGIAMEVAADDEQPFPAPVCRISNEKVEVEE